MKFDPFAWNEVQPNEEISAPKGKLRVRCSAPAPLYISAQGVEALAGIATEHDLEVAQAVSWRVDAPPGVRVFVHAVEPTSTVAAGEVFTNIDRMAHESEHLQEVTRARRMLEFERRQMVAEIRAERDAALSAMRTQGDTAPEADAVIEEDTPEAEAEGAEP